MKQNLVNAEKNFSSIPNERKDELKKLSTYIQERVTKHQKISLTFICTHNSRRSHFAQVWAQTAAAYYSISNVYCYSGGTETTAFNINAVKALEQSGFVISPITQSTNPHYEVKFAADAPAIDAYSKKYGDAPNPSKDYGAVLTCSQADASCPIVFGADGRFKVPYEDPKLSDGTNQQEKVYQERSLQIATEMMYVFSLIKN
ncbi:MAG: protein-tyrosine-phosphatase [Sphingobacteriia bacterium]|nr:MAG: protein-tyrosine-phosphatase [Sphingobacteriia bacterium]